MITRLLSPEWIYTLGWTLVDTLWMGAAFALLLGVCLVFMRSFSAHARYVLAIGLLFTFFGATIYQGFHHYQTVIDSTPSLITSFAEANGTATPAITIPNSSPASPLATTEIAPTFKERMVGYYDQHLPLIVTLWLMGVLVLQLRLLGQLAVVQRLKSYGTARFPKQWATALQQLEEQFDIQQPVRYLTSSKVMSPMVIGWLRPVVLFPSFLLDKLQESEIVGIMAHELAHVKRNDFLVNALQNILCTLFFYHPGIWWMSNRIEEEREHCCDDMAIAVTGQAMTLAKTLIHLKEHELNTPQLAAAFTGQRTGFQHRIRRMVTGYLRHASYGEGVITTLILVLAVSSVAFLNAQTPTPDPVTEPEPQSQSVTESSPAVEATALPAEIPPVETPLAPDEQPEPSPEPQMIPDPEPERHVDIYVTVDHDHNTQHTHRITHQEDYSPCDKLLNAIRLGDLDEMERLLKTVNVNCIDRDPAWYENEKHGWDQAAVTPLNTAIRMGRMDIVKRLLSHGADVNQYVEGDGTALLTAAAYGHLDIVKCLIERGVNPNNSFPNHGSAIIAAADNGQPEVIEYLLQYASSTEVSHPNQGTLLIAAANNGNTETVRYLLAEGAQVDARTLNQGTALIAAANNGELETIKALLAAGADINLRTSNQGTALIAAANNGHLATVRFLIENGAEVNRRTSNQGTALIAAANNGHTRVIRYLIEKDARVNGISPNQGTALIAAANNGHMAALEMLIRNGAAVDLISPNQGTALMAAANNGHLSVVKFLVEKGADHEIEFNNQTAITCAVGNGYMNVMKYLMDLDQD